MWSDSWRQVEVRKVELMKTFDKTYDCGQVEEEGTASSNKKVRFNNAK